MASAEPSLADDHVVLHSASKYLNGHSNVIADALCGSERCIDATPGVLMNLGGSLDPRACFLLERGLKTLALRVRHQSRSATPLKQALHRRPEIQQVLYPGLPSHPQRERPERLFDSFGRMLAFRLADASHTERFLDALRLPIHAGSLSAVESLVVQPARGIHLDMPKADRARRNRRSRPV